MKISYLQNIQHTEPNVQKSTVNIHLAYLLAFNSLLSFQGSFPLKN
jgi:hypothetical protein